MKKATRQLWFGIFGWSVVVLFMIIVAVQAIANIRSGNHAGGFRYDWQPLGPGIQLTALAFIIAALAVGAWQRFWWKGK